MGPEGKAQKLYVQVAENLAGMIDSGALTGGERLPSVRSLSKAKRVSIPTVIEAYRMLEDQGLIETRNRSGHYVKHKTYQLEHPATARVSGRPAVVDVLSKSQSIMGIALRPGLLPFGAAIPSPELFPVAKLREMMSGALRRRSYLLGEYAFAPGLPALRHEIARRALRWGCALDPGNIVVTNGCVEAVGLALRAVTNPGDTVAINSRPITAFFSFLRSSISRRSKYRVTQLPVSPWNICRDRSVGTKCKPACFLQPSRIRRGQPCLQRQRRRW